MFARLGNLVARHWFVVVLIWIIVVVCVRLAAPRWDDITHDGDFAYLPSNRPSVIGEQLLAEAFPHSHSKSQIVIIAVRDNAPLTTDDIFVANDLARRFRSIQGVAKYKQAKQFSEQASKLEQDSNQKDRRALRERATESLQQAKSALEEAIRLESLSNGYSSTKRLAESHHNLSLVYQRLNQPEEATKQREVALSLQPSLRDAGDHAIPQAAANWPLIDVWTWHDEIVGEKLTSNDKHAKLIILRLSNEFLAVDNMQVLESVQEELESVRKNLHEHTKPGLHLAVSGSAAVGGDILIASRDSIRHTELFTIVLVVLILAVVYRSPLLVAVPLITIVISLLTSTGVIALLTQLNHVPGFEWWELKVFTTTKIFIVVILFGAGTDFCLFLISRYKEELEGGVASKEATANALASVGDALTASALTTIFGLSMLFFAEFGKFRYSGPIIGLCLAITLLACMTLAPALLRAFGQWVFWPLGRMRLRGRAAANSSNMEPSLSRQSGRFEMLWHWTARQIVARPGFVLLGCFILLLPLAGYGFGSADNTTYDFLSALDTDRPSRQGAELLKRHFDVGEGGPIVVLAKKDGIEFLTSERDISYPERDAIWELTAKLHDVEGVVAVRSLGEPLGKRPTQLYSMQKTLQQNHRLTKSIYVTNAPELKRSVTRLEVVLAHDPFSIEATKALNRINERLQQERKNSDSFWVDTQFSYAGTTAAIRDLREVTRSDNSRIQVLVVVAVFSVLLLILRRPVVCAFMIVSVLFSYFVTIGATDLFFGFVYGSSYQGLDWKVPIFLFVILVAIGQDYNVYLATRVFEEQARYGPFAGIRRAVARTGGIISSCGVIMAGTFISMTSGTWGYMFGQGGGTLRSIVELGFALALGVTLDTFVVRPVLFPSFLALLCRWQTSTNPVIKKIASIAPISLEPERAAESQPLV